MGEININGFSGANNVRRIYYKGGIVEPRVILNADVDQTGHLIARKGKTSFVNLPGAHSLWAGASCMLCADATAMYRIHQGQAIIVGAVSGPSYPFAYVEAEDKVYISNPYWQGVFDISTNSISSWGIPQPPGPMLLSGDGNLPAGTYHVCMTNIAGTEISGNGPTTSIELTAEGGIQILNRPASALVWITDTDEGIFYLAGATGKVVDLPTAEPLPSFSCNPPPNLENLCYAFGRIWGSSGNVVYYSEPFKFALFNQTSNKFSFEGKVTLIAKVSTGLFIGMNEKTRFLAGTEPEQMAQSEAGSGSIKGTLAYCNNLPDLGSTSGSAEQGFVDVPVWLTAEGIVAGNSSGKLFNLTKNKIKMSLPSRGASLYRNLEGVFQFLTSFRAGNIGSGVGFRDDETYDVFKNGRIDLYNKSANLMGSSAGFADSATCTVTRGGMVV